MADGAFDWRNLDAGVTAALCGLDATDDTAANEALLLERFGSPPSEAIVEHGWDALREQWLLRDHRARRHVVDALRAAGRGDTSITTGSTGADLAYLRSCTIEPTLRATVHTALLGAGSMPGSVGVKSAPPTWEAFEASLTNVLAELATDQPLIISVRGTGVVQDGQGGSSYYVQVLKAEDGAVRVESVSNGHLNPHDRLSIDAQRHLVELGLQPPTHPPGADPADPSGSANYFCDVTPPVAPDHVAHLLCCALRDVYGAETPGFLVFQTFRNDGEPTEPLDLGIPREPLLSNSATSGAELMLPTPTTVAELSAELDRTLRPAFGGRDVVRDADGDIPIIFGSSAVYVRAVEDPPLIRVYAPVLSDLKISQPLIEKINELNARYILGKFVWAGSAVIASVDVPAVPYVGTHVLQAITMVGSVADELDDELQRDFGGRNASGAFVAPPSTDAEGGGYI